MALKNLLYSITCFGAILLTTQHFCAKIERIVGLASG
jgi:hypothetical protein